MVLNAKDGLSVVKVLPRGSRKWALSFKNNLRCTNLIDRFNLCLSDLCLNNLLNLSRSVLSFYCFNSRSCWLRRWLSNRSYRLSDRLRCWKCKRWTLRANRSIVPSKRKRRCCRVLLIRSRGAGSALGFDDFSSSAIVFSIAASN